MQGRTVDGLYLDRYQAELSKISGAVEVVMLYCRSAHRRRASRTWSHRSDLEIEALSLVSLVGGCERTLAHIQRKSNSLPSSLQQGSCCHV